MNTNKTIGLSLALSLLLAATNQSPAQNTRACPNGAIVISGVSSSATTSRFGSGYITRETDGTTCRTSNFCNMWIPRTSEGKTYTTSGHQGEGRQDSNREG